jgi:hypothetical protein
MVNECQISPPMIALHCGASARAGSRLLKEKIKSDTSVEFGVIPDLLPRPSS